MKRKKESVDYLPMVQPEDTEKKEEHGETELKPVKWVLLKPVGYPLRVVGEGKSPILTTDDSELFRTYAAEQWSGTKVKKGTFLFDQYMFPDFAFKVIEVEPSEGHITPDTVIKLAPRRRIKKIKTIKITFSDVIGQQKAKDKCKIIKYYLKYPKKFGEWAPRNVLFYGPPGTGKTMLAIALARETSASIYLTKATDLIGSHVGGGARRIHHLYKMAAETAPSIIFIDELDAIGLDRRYQSIRGDVSEVVNALLTEMDGLSQRSGVVTIGATNAPELLDPAIRSRFEEEIEFVLPDKEERYEILKLYAKKLPIPIEVDLEKISKITQGFSGRDLKEKVLKSALHLAILKDKNKITPDIIEEVLKPILKDKSKDTLKRLFL
ncbi:MAG: AAA family ATPase [Candidatus Odinarchaeia archaeon]